VPGSLKTDVELAKAAALARHAALGELRCQRNWSRLPGNSPAGRVGVSRLGLDLGIDSRVYNAGVCDGAPQPKPLRPSELARLAGVSTDTLRHYEQVGILPLPRRSPNGYREYPASALPRVQLVRSALAIGFTLEELTLILRARDRGRAPCRQVRALATEKLDELENLLRELTAARDELCNMLREWDAKLADAEAGERVGLLDVLAAKVSTSGAKAPQPIRLSPKRKRGR
jgi:MerR family copper efflux transcriptional regulator